MAIDLNFVMSTADEARLFTRHFKLVPRRWKDYAYARVLTWHRLPFTARSAASIPNLPGVYAFFITPGVPDGLNASYLMYIGETERLRTRFGQYIHRESGPRARAKLYEFFKKY